MFLNIVKCNPGRQKSFLVETTDLVSVGEGLVHVLFRSPLGYIRTGLEPEPSLPRDGPHMDHAGLFNLCRNVFPCFRIYKCFFVLFNHACQWSSGTPLAFSISDSMGEGESLEWCMQAIPLRQLLGAPTSREGPMHTIGAHCDVFSLRE